MIENKNILSPQDGYDKAAQWYDLRKWQRCALFFESAFTQEVVINNSLKSSPLVLDVGIGTGSHAQRIKALVPSARIAGVDVSEGMLRFARERVSSEDLLVHAEVPPLPFADGVFPLVLCNRVTSHIANLSDFLAEVHRVLSKGGICIMTDIAAEHNYDYANMPVISEEGNEDRVYISTHKHTQQEWDQGIQEAGLHIVAEHVVYSDEFKQFSDTEIPSTVKTDAHLPVFRFFVLRKGTQV